MQNKTWIRRVALKAGYSVEQVWDWYVSGVVTKQELIDGILGTPVYRKNMKDKFSF